MTRNLQDRSSLREKMSGEMRFVCCRPPEVCFIGSILFELQVLRFFRTAPVH